MNVWIVWCFAALVSSLEIEHFIPEPIEIRVADLPPPFATKSHTHLSEIVPLDETNQTLYVPQGFTVSVYAEGEIPGVDGPLRYPRWMAVTPNGEILVTESSRTHARTGLGYRTRTRLIRDDGKGKAIDSTIFGDDSNGLYRNHAAFNYKVCEDSHSPGMAFVHIKDSEYWFIVANSWDVRKYRYTIGDTSLGNQTGEIIAELPRVAKERHWTRTIINAPSGKSVYLSVGASSDHDLEVGLRATVSELDIDGLSPPRIIASGIRNPVGLVVHPVTKELYTTCVERDKLGNDVPPDYFTRVRQDEFFGWPVTHTSKDRLDPRYVFKKEDKVASQYPNLAASTVTPDVLFVAHSVPLGATFYNAENVTFPEQYRNGVFACLRGSWNRLPSTGYKLVYIPFEDNRPMGHYEDFVTGFGVSGKQNKTDSEELVARVLSKFAPNKVWGRPVGLLSLKDGSLLFSEEPNGRIYRVQILILITLLFMWLGGWIFFEFESHTHVDEHTNDLEYGLQVTAEKIHREAIQQETCQNKVSLDTVKRILQKYSPDNCSHEHGGHSWSLLGSQYFAFNIMTTIGHGYHHLSHNSSRIFAMLYAIIGIPLMITCVKTMAEPLDDILIFANRYWKIAIGSKDTRVEYAPISFILFFQIFWLVLNAWYEMEQGTLLFPDDVVTDSDKFFIAFYWQFQNVATIGLGDIRMADETNSKLRLVVSILVSSTFFVVLVRSFKRAWRHFVADWGRMKKKAKGVK